MCGVYDIVCAYCMLYNATTTYMYMYMYMYVTSTHLCVCVDIIHGQCISLGSTILCLFVMDSPSSSPHCACVLVFAATYMYMYMYVTVVYTSVCVCVSIILDVYRQCISLGSTILCLFMMDSPSLFSSLCVCMCYCLLLHTCTVHVCTL